MRCEASSTPRPDTNVRPSSLNMAFTNEATRRGSFTASSLPLGPNRITAPVSVGSYESNESHSFLDLESGFPTRCSRARNDSMVSRCTALVFASTLRLRRWSCVLRSSLVVHSTNTSRTTGIAKSDTRTTSTLSHGSTGARRTSRHRDRYTTVRTRCRMALSFCVETYRDVNGSMDRRCCHDWNVRTLD